MIQLPLVRTTPIHKDLLSFMVLFSTAGAMLCNARITRLKVVIKVLQGIRQRILVRGNELELTGRSSIQLATKLIIVAHPDDELIFGGDDIVGDDLNDTFVYAPLVTPAVLWHKRSSNN